jgi:glutathione synthase/RimK-type ligase-like ATP-grasp enzyme
MIIIIGSEEEFHSRYVFEKIQEKNIEVHYFDSRKYPVLNWSANSENDYIILDDKKLFTKDIQGLYWRWYYGITNCRTDIIFREKTSALESFLTGLEPISYNSLQAVELHRKKAVQSKLMENNGIRIPKTLITNDKNAVEEFYLNNNKQVIYKPVRGGAYTKKLKEKDFDRLDTLINCPTQFQEFIDGVDIRVYAFDSGEVFGGEIIAETIDFRADDNSKINKVKLPKKVQKDCLKVMKLLGLKYSGIDIRLNKDGEYVFIEANPAPMFYHFENMTKYPITETLIQNLIKQK